MSTVLSPCWPRPMRRWARYRAGRTLGLPMSSCRRSQRILCETLCSTEGFCAGSLILSWMTERGRARTGYPLYSKFRSDRAKGFRSFFCPGIPGAVRRMSAVGSRRWGVRPDAAGRPPGRLACSLWKPRLRRDVGRRGAAAGLWTEQRRLCTQWAFDGEDLGIGFDVMASKRPRCRAGARFGRGRLSVDGCAPFPA